jgi:predicted dehydrogenase
MGPVHHTAGTLDGEAEFVAGVFSSDPQKSKQSGYRFSLDPARVYADYHQMAAGEASLPAAERIDFVSIITPNIYHFEMAKTFLKNGFHVICEKPMTCTSAEAKELGRIVKQTGRVFALMHSYTGYPMVKQARNLVHDGLLGIINKIVVDYSQGWLSPFLEGNNQQSRAEIWRLDPKQTGLSCAMADIGVHAENLVRYITGLRIEELSADLSAFIPGNRLDVDGGLLVRFQGGARGVFNVSQISTGERNRFQIRVYGTEGSLGWNHEDPEHLVVKPANGQTIIYSEGSPLLCDDARKASRLPAGHPEGIIGAIANIYAEAYRAMRAPRKGEARPAYDFPTVEDGVVGMSFIETAIASTNSRYKWTRMRN